MLYLIWGLLNLGLFIFFIFTCIKATKLIRQRFNLFAAVFFVLALLSFAGQSKNDSNIEPGTNHIKTWKFVSKDSLNEGNASQRIILEKTLTSVYSLMIYYDDNKLTNVKTPISASTTHTGFIWGLNWHPTSINIKRINYYNQFRYFVDGEVEWKLLGATIYSQSKTYTGTTSLTQLDQ